MEALELFPYEQLKTVSDSSYTVQDSDNGKTLLMSDSVFNRNVTFLAPVNYPDGFKIRLIQLNTMYFNIVETQLNSVKNVDGHTKSKGRYAIIDCYKVGGSLIVFSGDTAP